MYDSLVRWCVPVFIMVSGALLLKTNREEPLPSFFKRRATKVLLPFLIWSIAFYIYGQMRSGDPLTFKGFTEEFLNNNIYFHLWFMYMIVALYLVTPIFRVFVQRAKPETIRYFLLLWFLISFIPVINHFTALDIPNYVKAASSYIGFFVLGYYLNTYGMKKTMRRSIYILALLGFVITAVGTFYATAGNNGHFDGIFYDYYRPNVILEALGVYLFFQERMKNYKNTKSSRLIVQLSNASFGVYLLHPIIRNFFFGYINIQSHTIFAVAGVALLTLLSSFLLILLLRKVPVIKKIIA